jgi:transcriptional regulator with XRE-family HTH domain
MEAIIEQFELDGLPLEDLELTLEEVQVWADHLASQEEESPEPTRGGLLKELRVLEGLSTRDLARNSGVSPSMISSIENDVRNPSRDTLLAICDAMGVGVTTINGLLLAFDFAPVQQDRTACKVMECLQDLHRVFYETRPNDERRNKPLSALMNAYDEWLD